MDTSLTPEQQNAAIEDALHSYPVASLPREITAGVMASIQAVPAPRPFRLAWTDLILGIVLSVCIGAIWFSLQNLPPLVVAHLRKESILLYQQFLLNAPWLVPLLSFGLGGFFAALTIPYLQQELRK